MKMTMTQLVANALAVNGATTVWTNSFKIGNIDNMTVMAKCATATSPAIQIQIEISYKLPSTEGSSDSNWVIPDAYPDIFSDIVDTTQHAKIFNPPYAKYARYKINGLPGNAADTTVTIYNMIQEMGRTFGDG